MPAISGRPLASDQSSNSSKPLKPQEAYMCTVAGAAFLVLGLAFSTKPKGFDYKFMSGAGFSGAMFLGAGLLKKKEFLEALAVCFFVLFTLMVAKNIYEGRSFVLIKVDLNRLFDQVSGFFKKNTQNIPQAVPVYPQAMPVTPSAPPWKNQ